MILMGAFTAVAVSWLLALLGWAWWQPFLVGIWWACSSPSSW